MVKKAFRDFHLGFITDILNNKIFWAVDNWKSLREIFKFKFFNIQSPELNVHVFGRFHSKLSCSPQLKKRCIFRTPRGRSVRSNGRRCSLTYSFPPTSRWWATICSAGFRFLPPPPPPPRRWRLQKATLRPPQPITPRRTVFVVGSSKRRARNECARGIDERILWKKDSECCEIKNSSGGRGNVGITQILECRVHDRRSL